MRRDFAYASIFVVLLFFGGASSALAATTYYANSSTGSDSNAGTSGAPFLTFQKAYTSASAGDTINLSGTFTWTDSGETGDAVNTGYTIGKNLTIVGQGADQTIVQAATASTTGDRRVFTVSAGVNATFKNLEIRNGRVSGVYGAGIQNNGTTTVIALRVDNNTSGQGGAGIDNLNYLTVASSTIDHNLCNGSTGMGCGLLNDFNIVAGGYMIVTDSTIAYNTITATTGYYSGAGLHLRKGSATVTNSTFSKNESCESAVGTDDPAATLTIKNTISANNIYHVGSFCTNTGAYIDFAFRQSGFGTIIDNGSNIIGVSSFYSWTGTGDWTDTNRDGTFAKQGGGSGTLSLDTVLASNSTLNATQTLALTASTSIAIDNGGTGSNGATSTVPALDQRGANRSGSTDIGAYEYGGTFGDSVAPSVSLTLPTNGASIGGSAIGMTATASDDVAVAGVTFYVNGIAAGAEDTSSPYAFTWNSLATTSGQKTVFAVARDTSNNYATSTSATVTLTNTPTPSAITASSTVRGAASVSWSTPYEGSSKMYFGVASALGSSTPEADSSGVTDHSVNLAGLPACTVYQYVTVSKTTGGDVATSSSSSLKTAGCTGGASIVSNSQGTVTTGAGGTLTEGKLTLAVPASFTATSSSATFQANQLDGSAFFSSITPPSGKKAVGTTVYNLKALTDESTTLSSFSTPLSVTLSYSDSDIAGLDPSTLKIQRYDSDWTALDSCTVDTTAKTVTCTTTHFSDFAIFGDSTASASSNSSAGGAPMIYGSGPTAPGYQVGSSSAATMVAAVSPAPLAASTTSMRTYQFSRTLRAQSAGEDVLELQKFLNQQGFVVAQRGLGSPGNETLVFGPATSRALIKFQEAHAKEVLAPFNLKKGTGILGEQTRKFINALP